MSTTTTTTIELKLVIVENGQEHPNPAFRVVMNSYPFAEELIEILRTTAVEASKKLCVKSKGTFGEMHHETSTSGREKQ